MKHSPTSSNLDRRLLSILLLPSWLSASVALLVGVAVGVCTVIAAHYQSSTLRVEVLTVHFQAPAAYRAISSKLLANNFINNLPLLIFWGLVGLVVYLLAANIFAALHNVAKLKSELDYVNVDRRELLMTAGVQLLIRLVVLGGWIAYIVFFFHHILPYCVAAALAGSGQSTSTQNGGYVLLAIVIMTLAIHLHIICLRLLLLRPRIFSNIHYIY